MFDGFTNAFFIRFFLFFSDLVSTIFKIMLQKKNMDQVSREEMARNRSGDKALFTLNRSDIKECDNRARNIKVPSGFGFRPGEIFSHTNKLKNSHAWKQVGFTIKMATRDPGGGYSNYFLTGVCGPRSETLTHI